jgi:hypothetical protein
LSADPELTHEQGGLIESRSRQIIQNDKPARSKRIARGEPVA